MPTINETITNGEDPVLNDFQRRIGVGSVNYALQRTGPTRRRNVITEEGPTRGTVGGFHTDHIAA